MVKTASNENHPIQYWNWEKTTKVRIREPRNILGSFDKVELASPAMNRTIIQAANKDVRLPGLPKSRPRCFRSSLKHYNAEKCLKTPRVCHCDCGC
jgi:hypothetical protein